MPDDAEAIARVHVASRRVAYAGLLPDREIDGRDEARRADRWRGYLDQGGAAAVALDAGDVAGFASWSPQRNSDLAARGCTGEIGALYVLPDRQRRGLGRSLLDHALAALRDRGHAAVSLEAFAENFDARAFYETMGGALLDQWDEQSDGRPISVVAYAWPSLLAITATASSTIGVGSSQ
jgi:GNAT superfamily N-acetyltransferase